jgi:hypothetical protein
MFHRMRNVLDKSCRENQNTHFTFNNFFFSKIMPFMRYFWKLWWSQGGHKWRHNMAHTNCKLVKQGYSHARTCTCQSFRTRMQEPTHVHTHTQIYNTYWFLSTRIVLWMRLNITLYVHCLSCMRIKYAFWLWPEQSVSMQIHKDRNYNPSSVELISLLFRLLMLQVISKRHCLSTEHHYRTVHFTGLSALHLHSLILPTDWRGITP